jgi:GT2 family glycosyltransferase
MRANAGKSLPMPPTLEDYAAFTRRRRSLLQSGAQPLVSVITVALNARDTLEATIDSVQSQEFSSFEHIVIDGGSRDGTVRLLEKRLRPQDWWISEPDRGISDAFNKGVASAVGTYILFMNADDRMSSNQLMTSVSAIQRTDADFVFGDLAFYEGGEFTYMLRGEPDFVHAIHRRMPAINHPTVLVRRSAFVRIGLFDLAYGCAMDYDWLLRLHKAGGTGFYDAAIHAHMNHDGVSAREFRQTIREVEKIAVSHGRSQIVARMERLIRGARKDAGHWIKNRDRALYDRLRGLINRSYSGR